MVKRSEVPVQDNGGQEIQGASQDNGGQEIQGAGQDNGGQEIQVAGQDNGGQEIQGAGQDNGVIPCQFTQKNLKITPDHLRFWWKLV